ncbi:MAG: fumarylacetoacetate hydrolase family protein [Candidatus Poribacteria bacterium]|nr:fumarylacetoacetate hydrolase family protein [Candidatus Poribacteria bacterium]
MSRIARFLKDGTVRYAQLQDADSLQPIAGDIFGSWHLTGETIPLNQVQLLAPVAPTNVIAIGLNYRAHAEESNMPLPERPVIFLKPTTAVCGPNDDIVLPQMAPDEVDYECELTIVIGKTARRVQEDDALDYALGYTCGHDVSARDCQLRLDAQWARGKSFDTFAPIGPWIETDMDPDNAPIRTRLNGEMMQESNTKDLIFSCRELISYLSHCMTLLPGTIIMTGTPSGVGFARKPPVFLRAGDVVEIEVEGIGVLRNRVVAESDSAA